MVKRSILLLIAYWLMMTGAVCAAGVTITVAGQAKIDGPFVLLGDLARIQGADGQRVSSLQNVQLAPAPPVGTSQVWSRDYLGARLAASGVDFSDVVWQIPDNLTVASAAQTVRGSQIAERALAVVNEQLATSGNGDEMDVAVLGDVADLTVPPGDVEIRIEFPGAIHYSGINAVRAVVLVNGQAAARSYVKIEVHLYRKIVVANCVIMKGQVIRDADLRLERTDVGRLNGYYVEAAKVTGLAAKRIINPGMAINGSMLEKPILVHHGTPVSIVARIAGMEVATSGQAMQDGRQGQLIRVMNLKSNRVVTGRVVDASTVQVITPGDSEAK